MEWEIIYAELMNKIRWAIASTVAGAFNYSYRDSQALATVLAGDALRLMKMRHEKPDLSLTPESVRALMETKG